MYQNGKISKDRIVNILSHGFRILSENKLKCFASTLEICYHVDAGDYGVTAYKTPQEIAEWSKWKLILNGEEYKSKFKDYFEWSKFYSR
jgi:hypothetical protein